MEFASYHRYWPSSAAIVESSNDAIITKTYAPILFLGCAGGLVIGGLIHGWRKPA